MNKYKNKGWGHVYLMHSNPYYKIGYAENVDKRLEQISNMNPHGVDVIVESRRLYQPKSFEKALHEKYKKRQIVSEWFAFSIDEVVEVISDIQAL